MPVTLAVILAKRLVKRLTVLLQIETPKKLTSKQEELLREFAETEDKAVNPESHGFWKRMTDFLGG